MGYTQAFNQRKCILFSGEEMFQAFLKTRVRINVWFFAPNVLESLIVTPKGIFVETVSYTYRATPTNPCSAMD
jgi:hypothetical protein